MGSPAWNMLSTRPFLLTVAETNGGIYGGPPTQSKRIQKTGCQPANERLTHRRGYLALGLERVLKKNSTAKESLNRLRDIILSWFHPGCRKGNNLFLSDRLRSLVGLARSCQSWRLSAQCGFCTLRLLPWSPSLNDMASAGVHLIWILVLVSPWHAMAIWMIIFIL